MGGKPNPPKKIGNVIEIALGIDALLDIIIELFGDSNTQGTDIIETQDLIRQDLAGLKQQLTDCCEEITSKLNEEVEPPPDYGKQIKLIQYVLTGVIGTDEDLPKYHIIGLDTDNEAIQRFEPGAGNLRDWLQYLVRGYPPNQTGTPRLVGTASGPSTFAIPDCWAVILHCTALPAGQAGSAHPDAPIYEYLGRYSLSAYGGSMAPQKINHEDQLIWTGPLQVTHIVIEPKPGVVFQVYAIPPKGFA